MGAMARRGWARITDSVADILRRGAWYPVVEETPDGHVVVDVREGVQVRLKREDVTVRVEPPTRWSVVVNPIAPGTARHTPSTPATPAIATATAATMTAGMKAMSIRSRLPAIVSMR